jgi:uncharacterized protein (TIGR00299 family) protein
MTTALFDIISGISGDMTIGALLDAGADFDCLKQEVAKLNLQGFELELSYVKRSEINAVKFDVRIHQQPQHHTHYTDIVKLISESSVSERVKENSLKIFETIAAAEAKIHNIPIEQIHFHEVGAIDSIVDIVGVCICIENLGVEEVYTTPVKLGRGMIKTQHGLMPNPAPATLEILKDYPVEFTNINHELTTPTGAAIVKSLSKGVYDEIALTNVKKIGYGSGTFEINESPNILRVIIGETASLSFVEELGEELFQIETNIDDMNPQVYPYVMGKLFEAGVRDVYYHDVTMKKGRPGILLSVLTDAQVLERALEIIYSETTTIGVRINKIDRHRLQREVKEFETSFGKIHAKVVSRDSYTRIVPEFEDCKRIAMEMNKPVNIVFEKLMGELNK